ncbi:hypothetical protein SAMN05421503_0706 [Terribacillus aidingensis]|uniref:Dolichyl-phosphate-mannose-protein mannosyltransferase n=1 Tax=Terribacillus aidingensis TaxID=586416 RepID=A0A285N593_9BACI|nr:DUF6020 family protein [Terribacillus aidingensis]SNZ04612.1 hypothetical protein SAMN05421503_0706 [Terribacillus aidingensis]
MLQFRNLLMSVAAGFAATISVLAVMQERQDTSLLKYAVLTAISICFFFAFLTFRRGVTHAILERRYILAGITILSVFTLISLIDWPLFLNRPWYETVIVDFISLAAIFCFFSFIAFLLLRGGYVWQRSEISKWTIVWYMLPMIFVWMFYLLAFFPGNMSPDSLNHWRQVENMEFNNWHPFAYTMVILALTQIWDSPAVIVIFQMLLLSFVYAYGLYSFRQYGLGKKIAWAAAILWAVLPINGIFSTILWKDVVYSTFIVFLTIFVMKTVLQEGKNLRTWSGIATFTVVLLGIAFFRNNGLPIAIMTAIGMLIAYRRIWKQLLTPLVLVSALYVIVTGPVFTAYNIQSANPNESMSIPTQQIAAVVSQDGELTEEQLAYLDSILPINDWNAYNPYLTDRIKFHDNFHDEVIVEDMGNYLSVWFDIVKQNPALVTEAYLKQTSLVWQINKPVDGYTNPYTIDVDPNEMGLETKPVSQTLYDGVEYLLETSRYHTEELFWRPAVFSIFIIFFTLIASRKLGAVAWLPILPVLFNTATIFVGLPAQDYRYLVSNAMVSIFFLLFASLYKKGKEPAYGVHAARK